jgi:hypothetical protein
MRPASTMTHKPLVTKRRPPRRVAVSKLLVRGARLRLAEHGHRGADLTKSTVEGFRRYPGPTGLRIRSYGATGPQIAAAVAFCTRYRPPGGPPMHQEPAAGIEEGPPLRKRASGLRSRTSVG